MKYSSKRSMKFVSLLMLNVWGGCQVRNQGPSDSLTKDTVTSTVSSFKIGEEKVDSNGSIWFDRCNVGGAPVQLLKMHPFDQSSALEIVFENKPENEFVFDFNTPVLEQVGDFVKFDKTVENIEVDPAANLITIKKAVRVRKGMPDENISIVVDRAKGEMKYRGSSASLTRTYSSCEFASSSWNNFLRLKENVPFLTCGGSKPEWMAEVSAFPRAKLLVTDARGIKFELPFLDLSEDEGGVIGYFRTEGKTLKSGLFRYDGKDASLTLFPKSKVSNDGIEADVVITDVAGSKIDSLKNCRVEPDAFAILVFN